MELSPRLSKQNAPFLLDPADFQQGGQFKQGDKPLDQQGVQAAQPAKSEDVAPTFQLPDSVTQAQTNALPEKKEDSSKGKRDEDVAQDNFMDQMQSEFGKFKSIMGPIFGQ